MNTKPTTSSSQSAENNSGKLPCKNSLNNPVDTATTMKPTSTTSSSSNESGLNNSGKLPCKKSLSFLADVGVMQQPTTEASSGNEQAAPRSPSTVTASLSSPHPGPYTSTHPEVSFRSEPEPGTENRHGDRNNKSTHTTMNTKLMFSSPKRAVLTPEGVYAALVTKVSVNSKEGTEAPVTVELEFTLTGLNQSVCRTYPAKMKGRSPLFRDAKSILRRGPSPEELEQGFDPDILKGEGCRVHIGHRLDHNGRPHSQTITVMAADATPVAAAAPAVAAATEPVAAVTA